MRQKLQYLKDISLWLKKCATEKYDITPEQLLQISGNLENISRDIEANYYAPPKIEDIPVLPESPRHIMPSTPYSNPYSENMTWTDRWSNLSPMMRAGITIAVFAIAYYFFIRKG